MGELEKSKDVVGKSEKSDQSDQGTSMSRMPAGDRHHLFSTMPTVTEESASQQAEDSAGRKRKRDELKEPETSTEDDRAKRSKMEQMYIPSAGEIEENEYIFDVVKKEKQKNKDDKVLDKAYNMIRMIHNEKKNPILRDRGKENWERYRSISDSKNLSSKEVIDKVAELYGKAIEKAKERDRKIDSLIALAASYRDAYHDKSGEHYTFATFNENMTKLRDARKTQNEEQRKESTNWLKAIHAFHMDSRLYSSINNHTPEFRGEIETILGNLRDINIIDGF